MDDLDESDYLSDYCYDEYINNLKYCPSTFVKMTATQLKTISHAPELKKSPTFAKMSSTKFKTISIAPGLKKPQSFENNQSMPMKEALKFAVAKKESRQDFNEMKIDSKTSAIGSDDVVTYPGHDAGFLSTIVEAYNHHYNLRTGPEDWWYTIIQTVAIAIDKKFKKRKS